MIKTAGRRQGKECLTDVALQWATIRHRAVEELRWVSQYIIIEEKLS